MADDEVSTEGAVTPVSDRSTTPVSVVPQKRKANKTNAEAEVDKALLESVKGLQELTKTKREETNKPDVNFCLDIAERLSGMTRQKNALVKMRVQQVLYEIEFAPENTGLEHFAFPAPQYPLSPPY